MSKLLFSTDTNTSKNLSRLYKQGKIRRIYRGIYTDNLNFPIEVIVKQHWMQIVAFLVPKGILTFRTALELRPVPFQKGQGVVFITSTYWKTISLPGLIIKVIKGNFDSYYEQVSHGLSRSNTARMLLENLKPVKKSVFKGIKTIADQGVSTYLAKEMKLQKVNILHKLQEDARVVAESLGLDYEYKKLTKIITELLSTSAESEQLKTPSATAAGEKEPVDVNRILLFEKLSLYLKRCIFNERCFQFNKDAYRNLSFFESYFSYNIKGTAISIDAAEDIIFSDLEINKHDPDSQALISYFSLANNFSEMSACPKYLGEFVDMIKSRHACLMKGHPDASPGEFKIEMNETGVTPEEVLGTLAKGFEIYLLLGPGLARAFFMQFLISEVCPFTSGNDKLAKIMMNAELVLEKQITIMLPPVLQDNYLDALKRISQEQDFQAYCKVLDQAQAYTHSIDWLHYGATRRKIETDHANKPEEGLPIFNRALRMLTLSEIPE